MEPYSLTVLLFLTSMTLCGAAALGPVSFDLLGQYERLGYG